jgi:hypothetical protein
VILETKPGRFRYTVILAATRRGLERFDSLDAMPPVLRARCLKALESRDSGTVLIAGAAVEQAEAAEPERAAPPAGEPGGVAGSGRAWRRLTRVGLELLATAAAASLLWLAWRG